MTIVLCFCYRILVCYLWIWSESRTCAVARTLISSNLIRVARAFSLKTTSNDIIHTNVVINSTKTYNYLTRWQLLRTIGHYGILIFQLLIISRIRDCCIRKGTIPQVHVVFFCWHDQLRFHVVMAASKVTNVK